MRDRKEYYRQYYAENKEKIQEYQRRYYLANRDSLREYQRQYDGFSGKEAVRAKRIWLRSYLAEHPCVDCGESDPVVLEFDHVTGEKSFGISDGASRRSQEAIEEEVGKCEVRCCNCHRRRHAADWWYVE